MAPLKWTSVLSLSLNRRPPPVRIFDGRVHARHRSTKSATNPTSTALPKPRLDYRALSENAVYKSHNAFNRKAPLPVGAIQSIERLYDRHKELSHLLNGKRHAQSLLGERIRRQRTSTIASNDGGDEGEEEARRAALQAAKQLKADISQLEQDLAQTDDQLFALASAVPNDTHPLAPLGPSSAAVVLSTHGPPNPLPHSSSPQRDHLSISRQLGLLDLEAGATVTGSSWYYLLREAALLEMVLTNYGLSIALNHGFTPVMTPDVVRSDVARRCGFHPRDTTTTNNNKDNDNGANTPAPSQMYHLAADHYHHPDALADSTTSPHPELVLSGTAEIPLAGMFANKILALEDLPHKVVGLGRAFRAEAGARGADTRGLYRVHQFTKLELFAVTRASQSEEVMEEMRRVQIEIFSGLGFPFRCVDNPPPRQWHIVFNFLLAVLLTEFLVRVLDMPTEELGASAYRKYDIEAWMPGRGSWGEISSLSNCTDYQARRLHIRHRPAPAPSSSSPSSQTSTGLPFAHTLNGTAVAVPRLIVALLENGARFNDSGQVVGIDLPIALKPFWPQAYSREAVRFSGRDVVQWV